MSYAVEISDAAQSDIREIFRYIALALRSGINASGQIQRIEDEIYSLSEMPERYPPVRKRTLVQPRPQTGDGRSLQHLLSGG